MVVVMVSFKRTRTKLRNFHPHHNDAEKLFAGHTNVYPKGGNMKKHSDGHNKTRLFTILIICNSGRKKEECKK